MAINFHPKPGTLLMCDYNTGFVAPEMIKKRPVVVVSRLSHQLAIVVPLSTTEPRILELHHVEMDQASLPMSLRRKRHWAKCDMVSHVALRRLDRIMEGKCPKTGRRIYISPKVTDVDLGQIRQALRHVLAL